MSLPRGASWDSLTPELVELVASCLPPNEVACTLRLLNKSLAKQLQRWTSVTLSRPVPPHAFARHWGDERVTHALPRKQRQRLLCLTACSGAISNLDVAVSAVGFPLTKEVFHAAAASGHVHVCEWLHDRRCPLHGYMAIQEAAKLGHAAVVRWLLSLHRPDPGLRSVMASASLVSAAEGGHRDLCEELLVAVWARRHLLSLAVYKAAAAGHVGLTDWLLAQAATSHDGGSINDAVLLSCAAYGYELPAFQRLYHARMGRGGAGGSNMAVAAAADEDFGWLCGPDVAFAAIASPKPDWRAKFEWLEAAAGCRLRGSAATVEYDMLPSVGGTAEPLAAAPTPEDALERIAFLRGLGLASFDRLAHRLFRAAVTSASAPVLRYLRTAGLFNLQDTGLTAVAAERGHVAVLVELLAAGYDIGPGDVRIAARDGHLHVLRWLAGLEEGAEAGAAETAGSEAGTAARGALREAMEGEDLIAHAAESGSLELVSWLRDKGCRLDERAFTAAAEVGHVAMLEWMAAGGCPMGDNGEPYLAAGRNGDFAVLRCLRRLGCPWDPHGHTFSLAVWDPSQKPCSLAVLRWLVDQGCPVDWKAAEIRAPVHAADGVMDWIRSQMPAAAASNQAAAAAAHFQEATPTAASSKAARGLAAAAEAAAAHGQAAEAATSDRAPNGVLGVNGPAAANSEAANWD
ncbi:hypothetical protein PLESTB_000585600 [Pleodorina starrii]|uniref:Ankyrin repeat domain-containing protein n=1 Tax=Pleodorina starrii TaxID=330485 RepID=A0A9W6F1A6_9CHLO|nr:hypothetical protein PLESTM_000299200 [Pleodorina starrii]GLC52125.1 hypothetical protein PLESTB_000585600 [Pleodorina starrii]